VDIGREASGRRKDDLSPLKALQPAQEHLHAHEASKEISEWRKRFSTDLQCARAPVKLFKA
jgi:hypothetical protein